MPIEEKNGDFQATALSTMTAWRFHVATGGAEKRMQLEEIAIPWKRPLAPGTTLIKVHMVCLNPVDIKFAETPLIGRFMHQMPAIPGLDGVGWVVETTDPTLKPGQLVMFRKLEKQSEGALAEYVLVSQQGCVAVPENVHPRQAATVGTCGVTAYQAIVPFIPPSGGNKSQFRVFINGGSGGTGTFQIQLAKARGCYVAASCSTRNVNLCRSLGADEVLDYLQEPPQDTLSRRVQEGIMQKFDLVVDNTDLPWERYRVAHKYMKEDATYVQIGGDFSMQAVKELVQIKLLPRSLGGGIINWKFLAMRTSRDDAGEVLHAMAQGKIKIPIEAEYPFTEVPMAYKKLKGGRTKGKIIIHVSDK